MKLTGTAGRGRIAAALLSLALVTACGGGETDDPGGSGSTSEPYSIGFLYSSEGPFASNSDLALQGVRYAVETINGEGGVNGRDLELVEIDGRNDPQSLITAVPRLVGEEEVIAIVGPVDSAGCEIACPLANELETPLISPGAGRPGVLDPARPYAFTLVQPDAANSAPVLEYVVESEGIKTAAIIVDEANATTKAQGELYNEVFESAGVDIVERVTFSSGDSSFASQITSIAAAAPDAIALAAGPADAARVAAEARTQGLDATLLGTGSLQSGGAEYIAGAGEAAEGTITAAQYNPGNLNEPAAGLLAAATEATGLDPIPLNFAYAYDAILIIASILEEQDIGAQGDSLDAARTALMEALNELENFEGMSGTLSFSDEGFSIRPQLIATVESGQFVISEVPS